MLMDIKRASIFTYTAGLSHKIRRFNIPVFNQNYLLVSMLCVYFFWVSFNTTAFD